MENKNIGANICSAISFVLTAAQTNDIMQLIMLILSIISVIVSISFTLYKWLKEAKKDGKITQEEIDEAINIVASGIEKINEEVKQHDNKRT